MAVVQFKPFHDEGRKGNWMQTFGGHKFWPVDPRPNEIHIIDIAAAISKACRYGGHCLRFYSVAEHCVLMLRVAQERGYPVRLQRAVLMHDASEAYLVDIPRPVKGSLPGYLEIEEPLMEAIAARFDFDWPLPAEVKGLDNAILTDERAQNMAPMHEVCGAQWGAPHPALGVRIGFWNPDHAFAEFMRAYAECRED